MTDQPATHPFARLTPDFIMDAIDSFGFRCDARILELNSYENRVYQIGVETDDTDQGEFIIAKFYRPDRWSREQLLEEHAFTLALDEQELSVVPPITLDGKSLFHFDGFDIAVFKRRGGRAPPVDDLTCLTILGRSIARIHNLGAVAPYQHRPTISVEEYAIDAAAFVLANNFVPPDLEEAYRTITDGLVTRVNDALAAVQPKLIRIHADCHLGNLLWRDDVPHFVDFDDTRMGPAIQDLWMLLSGSETMRQVQMKNILEGYQDFRELDLAELRLIEPLRTLRMMHHSAWLARRWDDPAFPRAFPFFNTPKYWSEHILELREQWAAMEAPALSIPW